jgi:hypothetical protein
MFFLQNKDYKMYKYYFISNKTNQAELIRIECTFDTK